MIGESSRILAPTLRLFAAPSRCGLAQAGPLSSEIRLAHFISSRSSAFQKSTMLLLRAQRCVSPFNLRPNLLANICPRSWQVRLRSAIKAKMPPTPDFAERLILSKSRSSSSANQPNRRFLPEPGVPL